jgi:hypothetical protein
MWGRHTESKTWYVMFQGRVGTTHRFWQPYLKDGFNHVVLLTSEAGGTLKLEPQAWGMAVHHTNVAVEDAVAACAGNMTAVLQVTVDYNRVPADYIPRGFLHCVSMAQAVLALRGGRWWFTPWLLYVYLMNKTFRDDHVQVVPVKPFVPFWKKG